jgi:hypothetical protein
MISRIVIVIKSWLFSVHKLDVWPQRSTWKARVRQRNWLSTIRPHNHQRFDHSLLMGKGVALFHKLFLERLCFDSHCTKYKPNSFNITSWQITISLASLQHSYHIRTRGISGRHSLCASKAVGCRIVLLLRGLQCRSLCVSMFQNVSQQLHW